MHRKTHTQMHVNLDMHGAHTQVCTYSLSLSLSLSRQNVNKEVWEVERVRNGKRERERERGGVYLVSEQGAQVPFSLTVRSGKLV